MDPASLILTALALATCAVALVCAARAARASGLRARLAWAGRSLALLGAAFAIWLPAELYGELVMVAPWGSDEFVWLPRAIWYQLAIMPVTVVPALVSLRWHRAGGVLFLAGTALMALLETIAPFGVIFPEMRVDLASRVFSYGPGLVTAALLLAGRAGPLLPPRQGAPLLAWRAGALLQPRR